MLKGQRIIHWVPQFAIAGFLGIALVSGCQVVAGIEGRKTDPIKDGCSLPTEGDAFLRIANLVPSAESVDVCIRAAGGEYTRPVYRDGGRECPNGLPFKAVSAPIAVSSGTLDLKVVAAGQTCKSAALGEATGVTVQAGQTLTVTRMAAASGGGAEVKVFPESATKGSGDQFLRLINAAVGTNGLVLGIGAGARLPTVVNVPLMPDPVPYGGVSSNKVPPPTGVIDANGYFSSPVNDLVVAVGESGQTKALVATLVKRAATRRTLFVVGDTSKAGEYPLRGVLCDENEVEGTRTSCSDTELSTLTVDVFNAGLYGAYAKREADRRPFVIDAIAKRDSDFMCVSEVSRQSDREAIIKAALDAGWVAAITATTDLNTIAPDRQTLDGTTPPAPTQPACNAATSSTTVDEVYACLSKNCATGTPATLSSGECISAQCASSVVKLYSQSKDDRRCVNCILAYGISGYSFEESKQACTTDLRQQFAFKGQSPSLLLSRLPIVAQETYVLAASTWRRAVLKAQVALSGDKRLDVYCGHVGANLRQTMPYPGDYALPDSVYGWDGEQITHATRIVDWVKAKSGSTPAIIAIDLSASEKAERNGTVLVADDNPKVVEKFRTSFVPAIPDGYTPACTRCPKALNPYNNEENFWNLRAFTLNMGDKPATDAQIILNQKNGVLDGPISDNFGFSVRILRPD